MFSCRYFHLTAERLKCLVMVLKSGVHSLSFVHTISNLVLIVYEVSLKLYFSLEFPYDMLHIWPKKFWSILAIWKSTSLADVPVQSTAKVSLNIKIPKQNDEKSDSSFVCFPLTIECYSRGFMSLNWCQYLFVFWCFVDAVLALVACWTLTALVIISPNAFAGEDSRICTGHLISNLILPCNKLGLDNFQTLSWDQRPFKR